ncbi:patatin-like protein [Sphingosinicella sp. LHD-64]|uniref:patatin-like protein n=1 Tax=Sphingosinicella sp. LHD-64 TaxID=3072139 RepID=UPI00280F38D0|nr:patatin-like protein [Sphingosinicella sp. LHD-64]MDQ8755082.1 patatin-like protein [Sphingosinicella sp. LHD-64]
MREKELRIALICYGGISLAVYMHGITKEIWRLACASRAFHAGDVDDPACTGVYYKLLQRIADEARLELRVLVDILAGASAGGINAVFLSHAIATGRPIDPLTELWLESADVDKLIDPEVGTLSRFAKSAAIPFAWLMSRQSGTVENTVEKEQRAEIRAKLASFVRAPWFAPPFGGPAFTGLLLDAFDAMDATPAGKSLLPDNQPLDLFVTATDFRGFPQKLQLNSPPEIVEREHRITLAFQDPGGTGRNFADPIELTFAARATASFPGAFPPFSVSELDKILDQRSRPWPTRNPFLARVLPGHKAAGDLEAILIDGSVLANAPFRPCIAALARRPARREVDRRFVYIDPKPGRRSVNLAGGGEAETPGFFTTIFGALSDIPREQPIRDNLETIEHLSGRIRRQRRIVRAMRPEVEAAIERALGSSFLFLSPTPKRLGKWRSHANDLAARAAGYAYAAYAHLKIATVAEEAANAIFRLGGEGDRVRKDRVRRAIWRVVDARGLVGSGVVTSSGVSPDAIAFLRDFDMGFRTRRLRFVARRLTRMAEELGGEREERESVRKLLNDMLARYHTREPQQADEPSRRAFEAVEERPEAAMAALARILDLRPLDEETDARLTEAFNVLPKGDRRSLLLNYLGYPFYDVATLPLLQGEGLDEFDPIKVDRISPDDATAIRKGGTEATLKGIQFNSFGAFFSRAYRENDYLWGRLHGADRLIDITLSALPDGVALTAESVAALKREAFRTIVAEEKPRLTAIPALFEQLEREIG